MGGLGDGWLNGCVIIEWMVGWVCGCCCMVAVAWFGGCMVVVGSSFRSLPRTMSSSSTNISSTTNV